MATSRQIQLSDLRDTSVYLDSFGAVGDGETDDRQALVNAMSNVSITGGVVKLNMDKKYRIGSAIVVPKNVHIVGELEMPGTNGNNFYTNYNALGSALYLDNTMTMSSGSSISKVFVKKTTFSYTDITTFSGLAIYVNGSGNVDMGSGLPVGDDVTIKDCMILGFYKAIYAEGAQRTRIENVNIDCTNGVEITNALDVPYLSRIHCWNFGTIAAVATGAMSNPDGLSLSRAGTAFKFINTVDWGKITDCFSYGYQYGFIIENCHSCVLTGCGADDVPEAGYSSTGQTGKIGFVVSGNCEDTILTNCQSASHEKGFYIGTNSNQHTMLNNCVAWYNRDHGIQIDSGDVSIRGGTLRNSAKGITNTNIANRILIDGVRFRSIDNLVVDSVSDFTYIRDPQFGNLIGSNDIIDKPRPHGVTPYENGTVQIPYDGDVFEISGTNPILRSILCGHGGRKITLIFRITGNCTVYDYDGTQTHMIYLAGGNDITLANRSTLTLISDGTNWYEVSRSSR